MAAVPGEIILLVSRRSLEKGILFTAQSTERLLSDDQCDCGNKLSRACYLIAFIKLREVPHLVLIEASGQLCYVIGL